MSSLALRLAHYFSPGARQRGTEYWRQQRVRFHSEGEDLVEGYVRGSRQYAVALDWEDPCLHAECSCPAFEREGSCKHLWATILAADAHDSLGQARRAPHLLLLSSQGEELVVVQPAAASVPNWRRRLEAHKAPAPAAAEPLVWRNNRRVIYALELEASQDAAFVVLALGVQERKRDGTWVYRRNPALRRALLPLLPADDAEILAYLTGARPEGYTYTSWRGLSAADNLPSPVRLGAPLVSLLLPRILATGRCVLKARDDWDAAAPLVWDDGAPWQFRAAVCRADGGWQVAGRLCRGGEVLEATRILILTTDGVVVTPGRVASWAPVSSFAALRDFHRAGPIRVRESERDALLAEVLDSPLAPDLELPEELHVREESITPVPCLAIERGDPRNSPREGRLQAQLKFAYDDWRVAAWMPHPGHFQATAHRYLRRDPAAENAARALLATLGFRFQDKNFGGPPVWTLPQAKLPAAARTLVEAGWQVEAEGKLFRRPGAQRLVVSSGIDWFELHGEVDYGAAQAPLPVLLQALRRGEGMVRLDDGSYGMLPEQWLRDFGGLAQMGVAEDGHLRFRANQAGLLDALLATQPEAACDATFERARAELRAFDGIRAAEQPPGFCGHLRDYQREGLAWLLFLRRFGLGGCLADDMGVGKTAQALALLEVRRAAAGADPALALIVAPRSLIFNWKQEAARFTPQLRIFDYTGAARTHDFSACDAVLTTYGTLRREILRLKAIPFDTIILDESQAIKNASTGSAKAARLLQGRQRLALSGTPVENRLAELWSLFEFLNPGMLGSAAAFEKIGAADKASGGGLDAETRAHLARVLRPMILRRTKEQVVRELPPKTEQTLRCDMKPPQRRLYDELRGHYRKSLLGQIDREGMAKSKIQVLEALLRLRQAACHPGLIDPRRRAEPSAKLDALLESLRAVLEEGHKALVFSQFTGMLAIVRERLDGAGTVYEYLDGRTRDRQARVERFQTDPACPLFLISLKAGGLGLNLTAAEYVFLLDPWWNPAVEAQAVDRAHRIGQTRAVSAYRLIASDSIEEKVLALQDNKRDLASALIGGRNSLIRDLRREDLETLLS